MYYRVVQRYKYSNNGSIAKTLSQENLNVDFYELVIILFMLK